jgi:thioredoxin reductase
VRAKLAGHGVALCEEDAVELLGKRGSLEGVRLQTGEVLDCDYLFFSLPENPVNGLARGLGCELDGDGHVVVDRQGRTSVEGVYAAGDLTPGEQLIQVAAGEGTLAGVACAESLLS